MRMILLALIVLGACSEAKPAAQPDPLDALIAREQREKIEARLDKVDRRLSMLEGAAIDGAHDRETADAEAREAEKSRALDALLHDGDERKIEQRVEALELQR